MSKKTLEIRDRTMAEKLAEGYRREGYSVQVVPTANGYVVEYDQRSAAAVKLEKAFEDKSRR